MLSKCMLDLKALKNYDFFRIKCPSVTAAVALTALNRKDLRSTTTAPVTLGHKDDKSNVPVV